MMIKNRLKLGLKRALIGLFFAIISLVGVGKVLTPVGNVYAEPVLEQSTEQSAEQTAEQSATQETGNTGVASIADATKDDCKNSLGAIGWLVCPTTGKIAEAVDWLYEKIENILIINPVVAEDSSPIYEVWKYIKGITNIVFIIFLLVVIYSQITGLGINNYGIKKALPKLIVAAVMVNLSFLLCSLAVDVSNIIGSSLRGVFSSIAEAAVPAATMTEAEMDLASARMYSQMGGVVPLAIGAGVIAFETGAIWMLIPVVFGAIVSVVTGLITIAMRQAVVALLVMISPLAMVANILPNTEQWFKKWKDLLYRMLVFYPMFSLLFGASNLAGFAIIASAKDGFTLMLGIAVQIFPLFFSWSLMKMSGTFLGDINAKLRGLADKSLAANRAWADSHRQATNAYYKQYGITPFSHLRRYLDNRKNLREKTTESLQTLRKNKANIYTQAKISNGYDGTKAEGTEEYLRPNKYTRIAKDLSSSNLASETATMDTSHVISNYGKYFVSKDIRDKVKIAEKAKDTATLKALELKDAEYRRSIIGGQNYLEFSRAQMTKENDEEADFNFMVNKFLSASIGNDPEGIRGELDEESMKKYRHYIMSSAGGLGVTGQARVLGKIIAKAAAVESNQRRDINIIANKFPPDKRKFRNFLFNYYIDDDGYATDKNGNRIEDTRDFLRVNAPEKLVMWEQYDENGPYYDWYDVNGNYVTRIYKKDKSSLKELISNFDAPINDPINNMLAIHAGIKEQPDSDIPVLRNMGLDSFRGTIGRALLGAPFKEKNAAFSPMVAEMVKKGYIKNYAQEYLAYLDSFNKATKPGAFNTQDADAINMFAAMINPEKWEEMFPTELIRGYRNVNGEEIYGIRYNDAGEKTIIPASEATREELMTRIKEKYIFPALPKIMNILSRQTPNTMDNQKPNTIEAFRNLKETMDKHYGEGKTISEVDPYRQEGNMREMKSDIQKAMYTMVDGEKHYSFMPNKKSKTDGGGSSESPTRSRNHVAEIFGIYNSSLDENDFAISVSEYCARYNETRWMVDAIEDFIVSEGYSVTKDDIYRKIVDDLLPYIES